MTITIWCTECDHKFSEGEPEITQFSGYDPRSIFYLDLPNSHCPECGEMKWRASGMIRETAIDLTLGQAQRLEV